MDARIALLALGATVIVIGVVGVVAVPAAVDDPRSGEDRPGHVDIADIVIEPAAVTGETATLDLAVDLQHRGAAVENVTIRHRALGAESGLLVDETTVVAGTVGAPDRDGETTINGSLDVDRAGGYHLETAVFADGERVTEQTTRIGGVAALTPSYADSSVEFTDGAVWPTVAVSVADAGDETATLSVSTSVTNHGDDPSEDLDLRVVLRQADSNVVAATERATVDTIRPGRTDTVTTSVTVPDGYNYYVDAALFDDDVLIDETQAVANLDPQETIDANETVEDVAFTVEDFAGETDEPVERPEEDAPATDVDDAAPGFGIVAAGVAVLFVALAIRRRS